MFLCKRRTYLLSGGVFIFGIGFCSHCLAQNVDTTTPKHAASNWDEHLLISINHWGYSNPGLDGPMEFLSNTSTVPIVAIPVGLYTLGVIDHDHDMALSGLTIGVGEGLAGVLGQVLKVIVKRDRPYRVLDDVRTPNGGDGGYSFPSGHATGAWSLAAGAILQYPKWYVIAPTASYAIAESISRSYLGLHYITDYLGGAVLGIGCAYLAYRCEDLLASWFAEFLPQAVSNDKTGMNLTPQFGPESYGLRFSCSLQQAPKLLQ
jgi:membrane-associated phospholipid phosphatase